MNEEKSRKQDPYCMLARQALEHYLLYGKSLELSQNDYAALEAELRSRRAGVFVSLHKGNALRGCIGTIQATQENIAEEIIANAVRAGVADPRFPPVKKAELAELHYKVDVLGVAEKVQSMSELDAKRYGVIVSLAYRRGLLLPDLEGVDSPEQQLSIALQKAAIASHEPYQIERFEVQRHA